MSTKCRERLTASCNLKDCWKFPPTSASKHGRKKVGEIIAKGRELGLGFKNGAKRYGIMPWILCNCNRKGNRDARQPSAAAAAAEPVPAESAQDTATRPAALPRDAGEVRAFHPDDPRGTAVEREFRRIARYQSMALPIAVIGARVSVPYNKKAAA